MNLIIWWREEQGKEYEGEGEFEKKKDYNLTFEPPKKNIELPSSKQISWDD